jgi:hypothetical protein
VDRQGLAGTYSAGVSQEVRANRLDVAVVGLAEGASGLEVLLASPALRQDRQRQCDLDVRHCVEWRVLVLAWWGDGDEGN